jgi:hypothetical protein
MPVMVTALAIVIALAVGVFLFVAGLPQRKDWFGAIEIKPGKSVWVQFRGDGVRLAESPEALEKASWLRAGPRPAEAGGYGWTDWAFITLPLGGERPQGWEKVEVSFSRGPWSSGYVRAQCRLTRTDAKGSQWTYVMDMFTLAELRESPKEVRPAAIPGRGEWQMGLAAQAVTEGNEGQPPAATSPAMTARVVLVVLKGTSAVVSQVLKDGQPVRASLTVRDDTGKVVAKDVRLSYPPSSGPSQTVPVPDTKRSYVCDATLDAGPAAGTLHATATVPAAAWKALEQQMPTTGVGSRGMMRGGGGGRMRMAGR